MEISLSFNDVKGYNSGRLLYKSKGMVPVTIPGKISFQPQRMESGIN